MQKICELQHDAERPITPIAAANLPPAPTISPDEIGGCVRPIDSWIASGLDVLSARTLKSVLDEAPGALPGMTGREVFCEVAQRFISSQPPKY
jgi:hypothetical protein